MWGWDHKMCHVIRWSALFTFWLVTYPISNLIPIHSFKPQITYITVVVLTFKLDIIRTLRKLVSLCNEIDILILDFITKASNAGIFVRVLIHEHLIYNTYDTWTLDLQYIWYMNTWFTTHATWTLDLQHIRNIAKQHSI